MLSAPDIAILGAVALLVFGPDQLPKVARKFGSVMRDVQNTSSQFIREMERAADEHDVAAERPHLEAVPSTYSQSEAGDAASIADAVNEDEAEKDDEPMLPGIEPELAATPRKTAEPAEF
ncbi:MAG TPA: twin-arginine translocase TatA/TatE family subunit [Candidatus Acidoferrales bacterium]|nr:twin-arginine translocase TatA/TatE family subunit [Candidatus Acidoferrales bacterium]